MHAIKIVLAILAGLSIIARIYLIGEEREPITAHEAVIDGIINGLLIYVLLN